MDSSVSSLLSIVRHQLRGIVREEIEFTPSTKRPLAPPPPVSSTIANVLTENGRLRSKFLKMKRWWTQITGEQCPSDEEICSDDGNFLNNDYHYFLNSKHDHEDDDEEHPSSVLLNRNRTIHRLNIVLSRMRQECVCGGVWVDSDGHDSVAARRELCQLRVLFDRFRYEPRQCRCSEYYKGLDRSQKDDEPLLRYHCASLPVVLENARLRSMIENRDRSSVTGADLLQDRREHRQQLYSLQKELRLSEEKFSNELHNLRSSYESELKARDASLEASEATILSLMDTIASQQAMWLQTETDMKNSFAAIEKEKQTLLNEKLSLQDTTVPRSLYLSKEHELRMTQNSLDATVFDLQNQRQNFSQRCQALEVDNANLQLELHDLQEKRKHQKKRKKNMEEAVKSGEVEVPSVMCDLLHNDRRLLLDVVQNLSQELLLNNLPVEKSRQTSNEEEENGKLIHFQFALEDERVLRERAEEALVAYQDETNAQFIALQNEKKLFEVNIIDNYNNLKEKFSILTNLHAQDLDQAAQHRLLLQRHLNENQELLNELKMENGHLQFTRTLFCNNIMQLEESMTKLKIELFQVTNDKMSYAEMLSDAWSQLATLAGLKNMETRARDEIVALQHEVRGWRAKCEDVIDANRELEKHIEFLQRCHESDGELGQRHLIDTN